MNATDATGPCRRAGSHLRRGTMYAVVLFAALLITTIGFSGLAAVRAQTRTRIHSQDLSGARRLAEAGLDWAFLQIANDAGWRSNLGNGDWISDFNAGHGTFTVNAVDPLDNDVPNGRYDPVDLTVRGEQSGARHMFRTRLEMEPIRSVLDVPFSTGGNLALVGVQASSNGPLFAGANVVASAAQVRADVEAVGTVSGASYHGAQVNSAANRAFPASANVFTYYLANGTPININDIPTARNDSILRNGDFESSTSHWRAPDGATLNTVSSGGAKDSFAENGSLGNEAGVTGGPYLVVSNRKDYKDGPLQDISTGLKSSGVGAYVLSGFVRGTKAATPINLSAELIVDPDSGSAQAQVVQLVLNGGTSWVAFSVPLNLNWTGQLDAASIQFITPSKDSQDFHLDDVELRLSCATCPRTIEGVLLSPARNPYGTRVTNASGIYIIDCQMQPLIVRNARIVGTLVIKNPGAGSAVTASMNWEAAVENLPILLTDGNLTISTSTALLQEKTTKSNFNPTGTPYRYIGGVEDSDAVDAYPSLLSGLVYTSAGLTLSNHPCFRGCVAAAGGVVMTSSFVDFTYDDRYALMPPPGFDDLRPRPMVVPGSFVQVVDP